MTLVYPDPSAGVDPAAEAWKVLVEVGNERRRQVSKGYSLISDDAYVDAELARAAAAYALVGGGKATGEMFYPWPGKPWTPEDRRAALISAAALAVAEIERLDRLCAAVAS